MSELNDSFLSKSIWNENIEFYNSIKKPIFWLLTLLYPCVFYVVLFKTPKNFGTLKWFLLFHIIAISTQWICTLFLIQFYTFVPSKITKVGGILVEFIDPKILYKAMYLVNSIAATSTLLIFCKRIFIILNMYRSVKTKFRTFIEVCVYFLVFILSSFVLAGLRIPDQTAVKNITKQISPYYPDCLDDPNVIVLIPPYPEILKKATIFFMIYLLSQVLITFFTAQLAYHLLSRRLTRQSEKTKRMHKKFNQRTFFQVLIITAFANIPWTISNVFTLFQWRVPQFTYVVDICSKNIPTACIIVLFLYYDPYQNWLKSQFFCIADKKTPVVISSRKYVDN